MIILESFHLYIWHCIKVLISAENKDKGNHDLISPCISKFCCLTPYTAKKSVDLGEEAMQSKLLQV